MPDKLVVTNRAALSAKYGARLADIEAAITKLRASDAKRGLVTELVYLDDAATHKATGQLVAEPGDPADNKAAIDAAYTHWAPDYLMLLGATDVIPHQDLRNPMFNVNSRDDNPFAWSDLPYACDAPYSQRIEQFLGPTRVVGRLPDIVAATDATYLVNRLLDAASAVPQPRSAFTGKFGLTAKAFVAAGTANLTTIFGDASGLVTSPTGGPNWPQAVIAQRSHVVSCHGGPASPTFFGDDGIDYPDALSASSLRGNVSQGAVATAECCYGAQLYNPADAYGKAGICSTFLEEGGVAYFGSTNVAYSDDAVVGWAGLITQFFWDAILRGESSGSATAEARQRYAAAQTDPAGMKTLAQFILLGDPSIHPVQVDPAPRSGKPHEDLLFDGIAPQVLDRAGRGSRRATLAQQGRYLAATTSFAGDASDEGRRPDILALGERLGAEVSYFTYPIREPGIVVNLVPEPDRRYHVMTAGRRLDNGITLIRGILALEVASEIVSVREFVSR